jgi:prepilin-type processing-associated H-X9-DG protein
VLDCAVTYDGVNYAWKAARSRHPGGVNTLYGDGSVSFTKNSVDRAGWMAVGTRSGGEIADVRQ